jgi:orotidine-5'-phosphate decarboxylase
MNPLLVALDVDTAWEALALADTLRGVAGGFKIGSRLFTAEGPSVVTRLVDRGDRVFLDLKFHDIPSTVAGAVEAATRLGVWMLNVHASGGLDMMRAAKAAAAETSAKTGARAPLVIAVTVLTSLEQQALARLGVGEGVEPHVDRLARLTSEAGLDGVVASPQEITRIRQWADSRFLIVTPGIRTGERTDDQARTSGAAEALRAGASYLVVGRPIIKAADPRAAAGRIVEELKESTPGSGEAGTPGDRR